MKKSALLFFAVIVIINTGVAQQIDFHQGVANKNFKAHDHRLTSDCKIKLDSVVILTRSSDSEPWIKTNRQIYEYDKEFRLVKMTVTSGIYDWYDSPKIARFVYNSAGLVDSVPFYYKPDGQVSDMDMYVKCFYDGSGRLYQSVTWDVLGGIYYRNTYSYNASGKVSEILMEEVWWGWAFIHNYTYDNEGKLIRYDAPGPYSMEANYEWNSNGKLIAEDFRSWYQKRKHTFYYNMDGNRVKSELYYWFQFSVPGSLKLIEYSKEEFDYLDVNYTDLVNLPLSPLKFNTTELDEIDYYPEKLISTITKTKLNYTLSGDSLDYQKSVYYYSELPITAINDKTIPDFSIFPNPASGHVTFSWQAGYDRLNLKIFQVSGACILDREISSRETVRLSRMPKGIYLYKLYGKNQLLKTGKLVFE